MTTKKEKEKKIKNIDIETKIESIVETNTNIETNIDTNIETNTNVETEIEKIPNENIKKRGRKPKGGKIVQQLLSNENNKENKINIILHLKCSMKDLQNDKDTPLEYYNFMNDFHYEYVKNEPLKNEILEKYNTNDLYETTNEDNTDKNVKNSHDYSLDKGEKNNKKELWNKIKQLQHNLHINNTRDKKSACFWCTYDFDNPPIYIPKHYLNNSYHVYGYFCSPECSVGYLMEENIDHSIKFERYHLLNHIYCKIYNYNRNIKPAPKPHYLLEKFCGNLSIQEYRNLLHNERLFLVVDKPLTRILPELHEDNDDFIINYKMIPSSISQQNNSSSSTNSYLLKKKMNKSADKFNSNNDLSLCKQ